MRKKTPSVVNSLTNAGSGGLLQPDSRIHMYGIPDIADPNSAEHNFFFN